jgi:NTP pyrophosphatase (non-canonical NTP hydrolase)
MNRLEELLIILSEECAEVAQAAIKCVRFGMDSEYQGMINRYQLERELGDFMAMFKLLCEETSIREEVVMDAAEAKLIKVEKFMTNKKPKPHCRYCNNTGMARSIQTGKPIPCICAVPAQPISKPHRRGPRQKSR